MYLEQDDNETSERAYQDRAELLIFAQYMHKHAEEVGDEAEMIRIEQFFAKSLLPAS